MSPASKYKQVTTAISCWAVVATCFFIPLSTSLLGIFSSLSVLFWLFSGNAVQFLRALRDNLPALLSFILFVLFIAGIAYTPVPYEQGFKALLKYRELLLIPIVTAIMAGNPKGRDYALNGFTAGCIVLLISSYAIYFSLIPEQKFGNSFVHHITHSFFMAILGFIALQKSITDPKLRYLWLVLLLATIINLIFINHGRAGMVLFVLLTIITIVQHCSLKMMVIGGLILVAVVGSVYKFSDNVSKRTEQAIWEIKHYAPGKSRTSLGMRFDWWHNSVDMIQASPLIGHGTGSFGAVQKEIKAKKTRPSDNPHNEYLFITVQLGLIGLFVYTMLLGTQIAASFKLPPDKRHFLQGAVAAMAVGCLANSFLFDSQQGHFYGFITALLLASDHRTSG